MRSPIKLPSTKLSSIIHSSSVRLAVTGLSRSGKTVFITSLIHNLLSAAHKPERMPLMDVVTRRSLIAARLESAAAQMAARFPYHENIKIMSGSPAAWPLGTADISEMEIAIKFKAKGGWRGIGGGPAELMLTLVDYPGEWLLDLPLLSLSFVEWSRKMTALCGQGVRVELAQDWLTAHAQHGHSSPDDETVAKSLHDLYRAYLNECRERFGLNYLQPGRFIRPGGLSDRPFFWFCPIQFPEGLEKPVAGSLGALMEARYEAYKTHAVEQFYKETFKKFNRQIVLVDVLRALNAGQDAFEDTRMALDHILKSFNYGGGGLVERIMGAKIDKVLYAATKADHVTLMQRDHLQALLERLVAGSSLQAKGAEANARSMAISSVKCTEDGTDMIDGRELGVVIGTPVGKERRVKFFPGVVPITPPTQAFWKDSFFDFPVFQPPRLDAAPISGIPHINLDKALDYLLGDKLV